ncbi:MAG: signal recognition particle-docking protein FtsY [SAR202 cluster bacterium]|nr:signal recognition particle-docking protein FtsY [SAR202 cluster bacterium]
MLRFFRRGDREDKNKTEQAVERTRRTWFRRVTRVFQRSQIDDEMWDELEELLISADVGVTTSMKLLDGLRDRIRSQAISRPDEALQELKAEMADLLSPKDGARAMETDEPPLVLLMAGVNGAGKTTSIAKLANLYKNEGKSVLLGAGDTFRAAAVEQLQTWGERLEIDVVAHRQGADPGAVAFDSVQAAVSRNADVVIIDTAGRLHTRSNLMDELKKIRNVIARQGVARSLKVVLTMDATTGQNGLIQARAFTEAIDCDGVFLSKLDGTAKGGVVLAIADDLDLPVLFIGTGEQPEDIAVFDAENFVDGLFSTADAAND